MRTRFIACLAALALCITAKATPSYLYNWSGANPSFAATWIFLDLPSSSNGSAADLVQFNTYTQLGSYFIRFEDVAPDTYVTEQLDSFIWDTTTITSMDLKITNENPGSSIRGVVAEFGADFVRVTYNGVVWEDFGSWVAWPDPIFVDGVPEAGSTVWLLALALACVVFAGKPRRA